MDASDFTSSVFTSILFTAFASIILFYRGYRVLPTEYLHYLFYSIIVIFYFEVNIVLASQFVVLVMIGSHFCGNAEYLMPLPITGALLIYKKAS